MAQNFQISQENWNLSRTRIRIESADPSVNWRGIVRGPFSQFGRTLPTNFSVTRSATDLAVGHCEILDACPWLPKLPLCYEAEITATTAAGDVVSRHKFGLRDSKLAGDRCYVGGERTVFRIVEKDAVADCDWSQWRETRTAMLVRQWSDSMLADALSEGVFLFAAPSEDVSEESLRQLESFACVAGVILPPDSPRIQSTNLWTLLAPSDSGSPTNEASPVDGVWTPPTELANVIQQTGSELPVFVYDSPADGPFDDLLDARSYCDQLQRKTANVSQCAGYAILSQ